MVLFMKNWGHSLKLFQIIHIKYWHQSALNAFCGASEQISFLRQCTMAGLGGFYPKNDETLKWAFNILCLVLNSFNMCLLEISLEIWQTGRKERLRQRKWY